MVRLEAKLRFCRFPMRSESWKRWHEFFYVLLLTEKFEHSPQAPEQLEKIHTIVQLSGCQVFSLHASQFSLCDMVRNSKPAQVGQNVNTSSLQVPLRRTWELMSEMLLQFRKLKKMSSHVGSIIAQAVSCFFF